MGELTFFCQRKLFIRVFVSQNSYDFLGEVNIAGGKVQQ